MIYIKVEDTKVTLGGQVKPSEEWFEYKGDIPQGTNLVWNTETGKIEVNKELEISYIIESLNRKINSNLNNVSVLLEYDNIDSIAKYIGYDNEYREQAEALGKWCALCWKTAGEIREELKTIETLPTIEELILRLPEYPGELPVADINTI